MVSGGPDTPLSKESVRKDWRGRYWIEESALSRVPDHFSTDDYI